MRYAKASDTHSALSYLPDFRGVSSQEDIEDRFYASAKMIMQSYKLVRQGSCWDISALELYLYHPAIWCDPSTHATRFSNDQQLDWGTWYVHRNTSPAPNRSGLDITAGFPSERISAGLLVAALGEKDGSATALKAIVRFDRPYSFVRRDRWSADEKKTLCEINHESIEVGILRLCERETAQETPLFIGPRKRLGKSVPEKFRNAHLRMATRRWPTSPNMVSFSPRG